MVVGSGGAWLFETPWLPSRGTSVSKVIASFAEKAAEPKPKAPEPKPKAPEPIVHDPHLPPIHCEEHSQQDHLDLVRRRARGEKEEARGDGEELEGPATKELKKLLRPNARAKRLAKLAKKHKCPPKVTEEILNASPWKIEKLLRVHPEKKKLKPKPKLGLQQKPEGPTLISRHAMNDEGPFPLEKRLAELAAHAYYLWGDAKYLSYKAEGTSVEVLAHTVERFARQADAAARRAAEASAVPMSVVPPRLPLHVSALHPAVAMALPEGNRSESASDKKREISYFL
jgi:hypothetical protein